MCRLLGYWTPVPAGVVDSLGETQFEQFTALGRLHADGWGMAWLDPRNGSVRTTSSPDGAYDDLRYRQLATQPLGSVGLVHLRWATPGLAVRPENTHPFHVGNIAFAHNGSISPVSGLDAMLTAQSARLLRGDTDSERYLHIVRQHIESCGDEVAGTVAAVQQIHAAFPTASLNALLLTPRRLIAIHVNCQATGPLESLPQEQVDALPYTPIDHHGHQYFAMSYRVSSAGVHVVSSGLPPAGWTPVPAEHVLVIDRAGHISEHPVDTK